MSAKGRRLALTLTTVLFLGFILANMKITFSSSIQGKIDVFTQKEPYNGKGLNMPSDAFGPEETVILSALVTYNDVVVKDLLVAFYVSPPSNNTFTLTSRTDTLGIAVVNFTIPTPSTNTSENELFGVWLVIGSVLIDGNIFQDTLTFKVDWIVKLISIRTINENLTYQSSFGIGGDVGFEIALRNIAMTSKNATLAIVLQDDLNVHVNSLNICDFEVQPNEKLVYLYGKLQIPKWAFIGTGKIYASVLTAPVSMGGVPYCPSVSTYFSIMTQKPLSITFHDVAVIHVEPSATSVELGQFLSVSAVVRNEGTEIETFNVSTYCDGALIGTLDIAALPPYSKTTINFLINTSSFNAGNYTITVSIPSLVNEADLTDNLFVDGIIEIKSAQTSIIHDIAIFDVNISATSLYIGDLLQINISVINKGTGTEHFDVGAYYDSSLIGTLRVDGLSPNSQITLIFMWNTSFMHEGFYQISATAILSNDITPSDNTFIDGIVNIKARPLEMIHDIAVLNVTPSHTSVYIGATINVEVFVKNHGNYNESFNVTLYYNSSIAGIISVTNMEIGAIRKLVFQWNTKDVAEGNYTLSAYASVVQGEINDINNWYYNGIVKIIAGPKGWFIPAWFYLPLLLFLVLVAILLFALFYRRRRKRQVGEAFSKGWTAWYYGYDLRGKKHKM